MDRMRRGKFSEEQIAMALRQGEAATSSFSWRAAPRWRAIGDCSRTIHQ